MKSLLLERAAGWLWILVPALYWALGAGASTPTQLQSQWEPGAHHLGDRVALTASIPIPEAKYFLTGTLAAGTFWGDTRVAAAEQAAPASIPGNLTLRIVVQAFVVGPARLTPLPITVNTSKGPVEYILQPPPLDISALLQEGEGPPPPDPPIPYPRPFPWPWIMGVTLLLALSAAAVRWAMVRAKRRMAERPPPPKPQETDPERWIREEVDRIFRTDTEPRIKYGMISQRLREYLYHRTALPFPDWTTDECSRGASRAPLFGEPEKERLSNSLRACDLAKFARYRPTKQVEEKTRVEIQELLEGLRQNLEAARKEGAA